MSGTASATCWTPSPRWSSLKMLICEALKNGRIGSLLANLMRECGLPHHHRLQARAVGLRRAVDVVGVELHLPEALEAQHVLHPQQRRLHGLEVRGDVIDALEPKRSRRPAGASCSCQAREERAVAAALEEAEGGVAERRGDREHRQRAAVVLKRWMSPISVPPRSSSRRKVCSMSSTSKTTVPTPSGACAGSARRGRPRRGARRRRRLTSPAWNTAELLPAARGQLGAGLADLGEVQLAQHEVAHPLQVVHVIDQRRDLADAQRFPGSVVMTPASARLVVTTVCSMAPKTLRPAPSSTSMRMCITRLQIGRAGGARCQGLAHAPLDQTGDAAGGVLVRHRARAQDGPGGQRPGAGDVGDQLGNEKCISPASQSPTTLPLRRHAHAQVQPARRARRRPARRG